MERQAGKEWPSIRERNVRSQTAIVESGHFVGPVPFGYRIEGDKYRKTLVVDETKRALVEGVFEKAIAGHSFREIVAWLRTSGVESSDVV